MALSANCTTGAGPAQSSEGRAQPLADRVEEAGRAGTARLLWGPLARPALAVVSRRRPVLAVVSRRRPA